MSFPTLDLPPELHERVRARLVQNATRRRMPRFVVPAAAALALCCAIAMGFMISRWGLHPPAPQPAKKSGEHCNDTRPGTHSDARGLTYGLDVPKGWTATASIDLVRYCESPVSIRDYDNGKGAGIEVYRGFSIRIAAIMDPKLDLKANKKLYQFPLRPDQIGAGVDTPYTRVDIGGRAGRLIRQDTVAWQVDGQWWSAVSAEVHGRRLVRYAGQLKIRGDHVTWPGAQAAGFQPSSPDPVPNLPEGSWQPVWNVCVRRGPDTSGACAIAFRSARWATGGDGYAPLKALQQRFGANTSGTGWWAPKGVYVMSWYDDETVGALASSWHLLALDSEQVTRLLGADQEGAAPRNFR